MQESGVYDSGMSGILLEYEVEGECMEEDFKARTNRCVKCIREASEWKNVNAWLFLILTGP